MALKPAGKRTVFAEVDAANRPSAPTGGMIDGARRGSRAAIRAWLIALFTLVVLMIVVGGLTRLTDSGLSITEWRPLTGAIPPLNSADWQAEFSRYQASPQYQLLTKGMDLADFQSIYWWEWGHRQLGRLIGLVWAAGFGFFWLTGRIPTGWTGKLLLVGALGGLQGVIGWWMVASGLTGSMTSVASYRLATHLGLAFLILGFIAWDVLLLARTEPELLTARRAREPKLAGLGTGLMHFAFLQVILGALVAGIDAGRSFTDWPLMAGQFLPPGAFTLTPLWTNLFENPGLVQFIHRMSGYLLVVLGLVVWLRGRKSVHPATRGAFHNIAGMLPVQVLLGILTVLLAAPLYLGLAHQIGAVILWVLILRGRFLATYPIVATIRGSA